MKKLKFLFFAFIFVMTFMSLPNVKALEYISPTKFAGKSPNDIFWVNSGSTLFGQFYYETPIETKEDYLLVTYCASGSISAYTGAVNVQADGFKFDTNTWCSTGNYSGTIQQIYFPVNYWVYTDTIAYMEDTATFRNPNNYNIQVRLLNVTNSSSLDMSMAILAYIKVQQSGQDYNEVLEQIKQNQQDYNEELGVVQDKLEETNTNINDIKDAINNDDVEGVEGSFESFEGFIAENSTITQLITMPITLYSSILNGLESTCQPFALGNLFGTNLTIPCINIGSYLGSTLWSMIDIIISGFAIFSISKKFIKIFNNFSSMKEGDVIDD